MPAKEEGKEERKRADRNHCSLSPAMILCYQVSQAERNKKDSGKKDKNLQRDQGGPLEGKGSGQHKAARKQ